MGTMSKEEILKILEDAKDKNSDVPMRLVRQAFEKLPEPCEDTVSRQAAIDIIEDFPHGSVWNVESMEEMVYRIKQLPFAQPEIIRCKDCKHWDGVDTCDVIDAPVWDNDFCSMAERRNDG